MSRATFEAGSRGIWLSNGRRRGRCHGPASTRDRRGVMRCAPCPSPPMPSVPSSWQISGERLSSLRLADAPALAAMRASLAQHGQLSPVCAFEERRRAGGVRRLQAAARGARSGATAAARRGRRAGRRRGRRAHARAARRPRADCLEEAWIVRALHREHHLSQGAIAARLRCHKSWVCRRLMLVEALDTSVQADVRSGPAGAPGGGAGVGVATWQPGSRSRRRDPARAHRAPDGRCWCGAADAADAGAQQAVLARWSRGARAARPDSPPRAASPTGSPCDITAIRRSAGRLQTCWSPRRLAALEPAASGLVRKSLGELAGVLRRAHARPSQARSPRAPARRRSHDRALADSRGDGPSGRRCCRRRG